MRRARWKDAGVIVVGVDENGLGPLLGPLVTTAVGFSLARYVPAAQVAAGRALGIDDSKATAGFGQMAVAEGLALAVVARRTGALPGNIDALFEGLLLERPKALQGACPDGAHAQCWAAPLSLPCFGGDVGAGHAMLDGLAARGIELVHARSAVACAGSLNQRLRVGQSRVEVDLELMELLVLDARATLAAELRAICGMVGGIRNYTAKLRHFPAGGVTPVRAKGGTLAYDVAGVGHVRFEIDADARHLPVALASMVGKYVRELWMARQNAFYRGHDPTLDEVSGYHDPITRRFVAASAGLRARLGVVDACFVRKNARSVVDDMQLSLPQLD
ncbi:MAG: hypothetical protein ABW252_20605 [Polyangiales bacterium]